MCTRKVFIENEKEIKYYQVGKVFRFRNITSAIISGTEEEKKYSRKKDINVIFHIFSQWGRLSDNFIDEKKLLVSEKNTVIFLPYSEFLVCKLEKDIEKGITYIYLREIQVGLGKYVNLWLDDTLLNVRNIKFRKYKEMINSTESYCKYRLI